MSFLDFLAVGAFYLGGILLPVVVVHAALALVSLVQRVLAIARAQLPRGGRPERAEGGRP